MSGKKVNGAKPGEDGYVTFEGAMKRLETIVAEMEGGTLNLEDMIARFEEGQRLTEFCTRKLNEVERKVEMLVKQGEKLETAPFADAEASHDEPPSGKARPADDELF